MQGTFRSKPTASRRGFLVHANNSPKRDVALILKNKLPFPDMGVRDPLLTETPQSVLARCGTLRGPQIPGLLPTRNKLTVSQNAGLTFELYQNFGNRTHITKRMPVLIEHPSRGEEGDSTRTEPVSI